MNHSDIPREVINDLISPYMNLTPYELFRFRNLNNNMRRRYLTVRNNLLGDPNIMETILRNDDVDLLIALKEHMSFNILRSRMVHSSFGQYILRYLPGNVLNALALSQDTQEILIYLLRDYDAEMVQNMVYTADHLQEQNKGKFFVQLIKDFVQNPENTHAILEGTIEYPLDQDYNIGNMMQVLRKWNVQIPRDILESAYKFYTGITESVYQDIDNGRYWILEYPYQS